MCPSTGRVILRPPEANDRGAFLAAVRHSRMLHRPWVAPPTTPAAFDEYLERARSEAHRGFLVVHHQTGALVGVINLNHIIAGRLRSAFLGYYGFEPFAGQGLMQEGMELVLRHAFRKLKLHRLEANIQPGNRASIALARRCGFVREGFSRRYLKIGGRWRDHERWAVLSEDWSARRRSRSAR